MKKLLTLLFVSMMFIGLAGCGQGKKDEPVTPTGEIKTMGDLFRVGYIGFEYDIESFVIETEDTVYELTMTPELHEKLEAVDFFAEDRDEKFAEILSDYPFEKETKKADLLLSEEQLAAYVGKPGKALLDDGFTVNACFYGENETTYYVNKDYNGYTVVCDGKLVNAEDVNMDEELSNMVVKSIVPGTDN